MIDAIVAAALGTVFIVLSVGLSSVFLRAARGHLTRNSATGLRSDRTMASEAAWQAGHRAALPAILTGSTIVGAGSLVLVISAVTRTATPQRTQAIGGLSAIVLVVAVAIGSYLAHLRLAVTSASTAPTDNDTLTVDDPNRGDASG